MIRTRLILTGYLKNKYLSEIEITYNKSVKVLQILKDAKINPADVWLIKVGDLIVKEDYLLTKSNEVKLFPIIGGG